MLTFINLVFMANATCVKRIGQYLVDVSPTICSARRSLTKGAHRSDRQSDTSFYRHLSACSNCRLKPRPTTEKLRRIRRWDQEDVLDDIERRLKKPDAVRIRRSTVEQPFGT